MAIRSGYDQIRSHSIAEIAEALGLNDELLSIGKRLDIYYISTRYPDAFPGGAPFENFTREQASEALAMADQLVAIVESKMGQRGGA